MIPLRDDHPTSAFPYVTVAIISINTLVFFYQLTLTAKQQALLMFRAGAIPYEIANFVDTYPPSVISPPLTLLSSMFLHGGILHLAGNMLYLWVFGDNIEEYLGHVKFIVFYIATGVAAALFHVYSNLGSTLPMIGASGAIAGILGGYLVTFPRARVSTLIFLFIFVDIVKLPAIIFLALWFSIQLLNSGSGGGIAWSAHIGGFISGVILIRVLAMFKQHPDKNMV